ncbi:hypothetical protein B0H14DRAFT_1312296 [Mycena olivaceomarginata]|nr:hypothetical protein B0H14DRAFT_1312296 [Mycena olivaceomarginata]
MLPWRTWFHLYDFGLHLVHPVLSIFTIFTFAFMFKETNDLFEQWAIIIIFLFILVRYYQSLYDSSPRIYIAILLCSLMWNLVLDGVLFRSHVHLQSPQISLVICLFINTFVYLLEAICVNWYIHHHTERRGSWYSRVFF